MIVQPYLFFSGRCDEALAFYGKALGAKVDFLMRFKDAPGKGMPLPEGWQNKVMHATISIGETQIMASDGMGEEKDKTPFKGFSLSVTLKDKADAEKAFKALGAEGGTVTMPFQETFWAKGFGMVSDRFGVLWIVSTME